MSYDGSGSQYTPAGQVRQYGDLASGFQNRWRRSRAFRRAVRGVLFTLIGLFVAALLLRQP